MTYKDFCDIRRGILEGVTKQRWAEPDQVAEFREMAHQCTLKPLDVWELQMLRAVGMASTLLREGQQKEVSDLLPSLISDLIFGYAVALEEMRADTRQLKLPFDM